MLKTKRFENMVNRIMIRITFDRDLSHVVK